ncbi:MAG: hypothetical protein Q8P62_02770 [Candidatus Peregrinibacteria bacterium]|nr:hypothetical protein [Candidatus Peregrinibacteria bacterium]
MDGNRMPDTTRMDRIFVPDDDESMRIPEEERTAVNHISDLIFNRIMVIFEMSVFRVSIGTALKPVARELVDRFVAEMTSNRLHGRHIGLIAQNVLRRLDKYLNTVKN